MTDIDQTSETGKAPERGKWPGWVLPLFIVLLTIALFIAVLLPAQNRARESARRTECLRNLSEAILGMNQYALDNSGSYPWADIEFDQSYRCFGRLLPAYIDSPERLTCPSSRDKPLRLDNDRENGQLLTVEQCRRSLSYAYSHNRDKPWTEAAQATARIVADKYANTDYSDDPFPRRTPAHHLNTRTDGKPGGRNVAYVDCSARWDNNKGPLEADPESEVDDSGDPEHDQTGPEWWSDPPEK